MSEVLEIKEYSQLLALHRALIEAKFNPNPNDSEVAISPFVAEISNQVVNTLMDIELKRGHVSRANDWSEWRVIDSSRREWQVALGRAKDTEKWNSLSLNEKKRLVTILLSPFTVSEEQIEVFISQVSSER